MKGELCMRKKVLIGMGVFISVILVISAVLLLKKDVSNDDVKVNFIEEEENGAEKPISEETDPSYKLGNSMGNQNGGSGIAAQEGEWIYFCNASDERRIYKMKLDGSGKEKISDDSAASLEVLDGWIYYRNDSDGLKLYKMTVEGSEKVCLRNDGTYRHKVMGEWIYFIYENIDLIIEGGTSPDYLGKMRLDGTEFTLLSLEDCNTFAVSEGWIYVAINGEESKNSSGIYKMDTSGEIIQKLSDNVGGYLNIVDGWLYFFNHEDFKLYRVRTDGTSEEKICDDRAEYIHVYKDWIYYCAVEEDQHLYRIRIDGSSKEKLSDDRVNEICIIGDRLVYTNVLKEGGAYPEMETVTTKLDGTDRKLLK